MSNDQTSNQQITVADLVKLLQGSYKLLVISALLGAACAGIIGLNMTPTYRAEALVVPINAGGADAGLSGLAGHIGGGLASFASFYSPGSGERETEAIATIESRSLTQKWISDNNLLPVLFSKDWDSANSRWKSADPKKIPTLWDANRLMLKVRKVAQDKKNGLVVISIDWKDPELAAKWVTELINRTNDILRTRAIERSERNLTFLRQQLELTSVVEIRQSIYQLIENEIKNTMFAQGSSEYAFKVIDPAVVPEDKISPKLPLMIAVGFAAGFILSFIFVFLREPLQKPGSRLSR